MCVRGGGSEQEKEMKPEVKVHIDLEDAELHRWLCQRPRTAAAEGK